MRSAVHCLLLLSAAVAVIAVVIIDDETVEKSWLAFKKEHGKSYDTLDEELYRRSVFEKALQRVFVHQLAYDRGEETFEIGINKFSDITYEEFVGDRKVTCSIKRHSGNATDASEHSETLLRELGTPPAEIDWQKLGYVSMDVRNQNIGACGGCYAFGATSTMESAWAIKNKLKNKVPNLSEQQVIDCSKNFGCSGCAGGHPCGVYDMVIKDGGMMSEKDYPWRKDQKKASKCLFEIKKVVAKITKYKEFDRLKDPEKILVENVGLVGPTTASVCANQKFKDYKGGSFNDKNCFSECIKSGKHSDGINHTIVVIGYTKTHFIIRNSWGDKWGDKGNMMIARTAGKGDEICNLGSDQSYPIV